MPSRYKGGLRPFFINIPKAIIDMDISVSGAGVLNGVTDRLVHLGHEKAELIVSVFG